VRAQDFARSLGQAGCHKKHKEHKYFVPFVPFVADTIRRDDRYPDLNIMTI